MKQKTLLFICSIVILASCSTAYKSGQTPDDVYYSPATKIEDAVIVRHEEEKNIGRRYYADRQILMSIHDPRWRYFNDDFNYAYDPYRFGYNYGYYYNPYYYAYPIFISGTMVINPKNSSIRTTNLGSYNYSNMVVMNQKDNSTRLIHNSRPYNNSNNSSDFIRRIITPPTNSSNNIYRGSDNNTRSYSPSSSGGSSSSGSSGSSSGSSVPRPTRGGR